MKIMIFTTEPFPNGYAATNRIISYCYGLRKNYVDVLVISTRLNPICSDENYKFIDGIKIISFKVNKKLINKIINRIFKYISPICFLLVFITQLVVNKMDAVIFYGTHRFYETMICSLCKIFKVISLKEESEHPSVLIPSNHSFLSKVIFYMRERYKKYDGILAMTNQLCSYFQEVISDKRKIKLIPQTVISQRFEHISYFDDIKFKRYIAYSGSLSEKKDGLISLIRSFKIVNQKYPDIGLVLVGFGTSKQIQLVNNKISELELNSMTQIYLNLAIYQIQSILYNADLLVSARPYSIQALYGFPTKIAEYLATGKPLVTTAYGDLKDYLINGVNAFIVESSNYIIFANKIIEILDNYDKAIEIGKKGKELAINSFNPTKQAKMIIDFISELRIWKKY